ncbi:MAG: IclR family transcriptional regulator, partial [Chloroflexi bacterium]|nr:IclR family transcriptional regulator [Chloroflexota bacterium]
RVDSPASHTLTSARRALQVLELVARHPRGLSPKAIARELGLSLPTVYNLLTTLRREGFVQRSRWHGGIALGSKVALLYQGYLASAAELSQVVGAVNDLRDQTDARTYLAVYDGDVEIVEVASRRGWRELPGLGRGFRGAAHALALGKVLLAALDPTAWPVYLQRERFERFTERTLVWPQDLQRELRQVRASGVAFDRQEYACGGCCIAAPIYQAAGQLVAALALSVPATRFQHEEELLTRAVRRCAAAASQALGYPLAKR